jgi:outer membrane biogenesis lipoprotein LolB
MMKAKGGLLAAVVVCALLSACATSGTRVSTASDTYRQMARSQQAWCAQFGCNCYLDGVQTSCSLVAACLNSGNCQRVQ